MTTEKPAKPAKVVSPWNPANAVTASRFLTLPPFFWAVDHGYHQWATLFMLICGLLDKADGAVAKLFDCRSAFGELFDAITDGTVPTPSFADGVANQRILTSIERAAKSRRWESVR